jgi:sugar/nucleoside kinase (ribokinase family)
MPGENIFSGGSLCVVGNINRDLKTSPLPPGDYLFRDGETSVSRITETIGGGGANSAMAACSLGARVTFLGKVGKDELGDRLERALTRHGVSARLVRDRAKASGSSIALAFDNGDRHFISCLPANEALSPDDLDLGALPGHDHLLRADIWFSEAMLFGGNKELFQSARKAGLETSIDLNWDPRWGRAGAGEIAARKQAVRDILPWVSLAHGNVRELTEFADAPDLEGALKRLVDWGAEGVVAHLGSKGAGYFNEGGFLVEPSAPVKARAHTTGTGDVLSVCMMLLHRRTELDMTARLRLSNAMVAQYMEGSRELIPPLAD